MTEPRIIIWDLETMPNLKEVMKVLPSLGDYPGLTLKASLNSIICFGYKVYAQDQKTSCVNAWDFKRWSKDVNDDYEIVKAARDILETADAIVTHNGKRFDWKFLQTRLLIHNLKPLPKIPHIDTCMVAKSHLYLFNNRLNTLAKFLTTEEKMENGGWELWVKVMNRDTKAMKIMTEYCKQDVNVLEKIFIKLKPVINNIPNYNLFQNGGKSINMCPSCGSTRLQKSGIITSKTAIKQRYRCLDCGSSCSTNKKDTLPRSL